MSTASTRKNATSHGRDRRTPSIASAASGLITAHRIMPLEAANPPSATCKSAGSSRKHVSWVVRKMSKRFVRASTTSPTRVTTWNVAGIAAASGSSKAR